MADKSVPIALEGQLWRFALDVYGVEGVAAECLELQERHSADVCVVLAAAYAAVIGRPPVHGVIAEWDREVRDWRESVVSSLRVLRTRLKSLQADVNIAGLREAVLAAELQAEQIELRLLSEAIARNDELSDLSTRDRIRRAVDTATSFYASEPVAMKRLVDAATAWSR